MLHSSVRFMEIRKSAYMKWPSALFGLSSMPRRNSRSAAGPIVVIGPHDVGKSDVGFSK